MVFDEKATQQKRDEVAAMVTPIEYKKGQNIVRKGELVTDDQYEVLKKPWNVIGRIHFDQTVRGGDDLHCIDVYNVRRIPRGI